MLSGYKVNEDGIIQQEDCHDSIQYDINYIEQRYNTYGEKNRQMSELRFNNIVKNIGSVPYSVLDIGYGNGSFLDYSKQFCRAYGNDVSGYPVPEQVEFVEDVFKNFYDVITMFDVIEHLKDPYLIKNFKCNYLVLTVPYCHHTLLGDDWFRNWKHRRPNEHLSHFGEKALVNMAQRCGYRLVNLSSVEDEIRKPVDGYPNTLTGVFTRLQ